MSTENNIVQLQRLFDKYIYSSYDEEVLSKYAEEELEELANNILTRKFLVNTLTWQNIYEFFPNKEDFFSNLRTYAKTIIQLKEASNISTHLLLCSCSNTNDGVSITHTAIGLKLYLYRRSNASIYNNSINITFLKAFERYKLNADFLYNILSDGYQFNCTIDDFKEKLNVSYDNSMLKFRVLSPAEEVVHNLFEQGKIPFYFKFSLQRSIIGRGSKIIKIHFETIDNIVLLRLKRMRPQYMNFIITQLAKFLPFDYPFIEEYSLKKADDETIENIYRMIRDIDKDPDFNKLATPTLVKFKLLNEFDIKTDY